MSQLGFELGLLVWQADFPPTRSSRPATSSYLKHLVIHSMLSSVTTIASLEINKRNVWFQRDGTPAHTANSKQNMNVWFQWDGMPPVQETRYKTCYKGFLEMESSQKLCGLHKAVIWHQMIYLWGTVKNYVFGQNPTSLDNHWRHSGNWLGLHCAHFFNHFWIISTSNSPFYIA